MSNKQWDDLVGPVQVELEALITSGDNMADRTEELQAQLAEVTAERDRKDAALKRQAVAAKTLRQRTLAEVQHIKDNQHKVYVASRTLDSEREANAILTDEVETYRAAIPVAYQMALDAGKMIAAEWEETWEKRDDERASVGAGYVFRDIRALTPPADLVEQVMAKVKGDE